MKSFISFWLGPIVWPEIFWVDQLVDPITFEGGKIFRNGLHREDTQTLLYQFERKKRGVGGSVVVVGSSSTEKFPYIIRFRIYLVSYPPVAIVYGSSSIDLFILRRLSCFSSHLRLY